MGVGLAARGRLEGACPAMEAIPARRLACRPLGDAAKLAAGAAGACGAYGLRPKPAGC